MALKSRYPILPRRSTPVRGPGLPPAAAHDPMGWFKRQVFGLSSSTISSNSPNKVIARAPQGIPTIGKMYLFRYDAKHKDKLPYWDKFPLIICFNLNVHSFYGINLHYVHPVIRGQIMATLERYTSDDRFDERTRLKVSWEILKRAAGSRHVKACVKQYLWDHVRGKIALIPASEWGAVIKLPLQRFQGARVSRVWAESERK